MKKIIALIMFLGTVGFLKSAHAEAIFITFVDSPRQCSEIAYKEGYKKYSVVADHFSDSLFCFGYL